MTPNTHVLRHPGVESRKLKKIFRKKTVYGNVVSDLWKKWFKLYVKLH